MAKSFSALWRKTWYPVFSKSFAGAGLSTSLAGFFTSTCWGGSGTYSPVTLTANDRSVLYLGAENKLYWPSADETIGAFRAYFQLSKGEEARQFVLNFDGENTTTILSPAEIAEIAEMAGAWYDLQGRRVERSMFNVPRNATLSKRERSTLQKGVYIRKGRKVVVK